MEMIVQKPEKALGYTEVGLAVFFIEVTFSKPKADMTWTKLLTTEGISDNSFLSSIEFVK